VSIERERERLVFADLKALKRPWSKKAVFGWVLLGLAAVSEGVAWVFYTRGNDQYQGTDEFEQSRMLTGGLHIGAGALGAAGLTLVTWWLLEPKPGVPSSGSQTSTFLSGGALSAGAGW
jgi:hypothetical protein